MPPWRDLLVKRRRSGSEWHAECSDSSCTVQAKSPPGQAAGHHDSSAFACCAAFSFCARSCSTTCLLQLSRTAKSAQLPRGKRNAARNALSAWIEAISLGHPVPEFFVGAQLPRQSGDAEDDETKDGRVGLPVGRLRVPTTGRRPDVLGIASEGRRASERVEIRCEAASRVRVRGKLTGSFDRRPTERHQHQQISQGQLHTKTYHCDLVEWDDVGVA